MDDLDLEPSMTIAPAARNLPRLDEYFGLWSIEPSRGLSMFDRARRMDLPSHIAAIEAPRPAAGIKAIEEIHAALIVDDEPDDDDVEPQGRIAVLRVNGTLMKQQSSLDASTSTVVLRRQLRDIAASGKYDGCILVFDSPGGSVAGTADAADDINALANSIPVIAHVEDLCASAAYWLASQCDEIYANTGTALVGSIGTFIGTYDYSQACEKDGIQAKVYATGPLKGAGFPGAKITPEQDAYFQNIVDQTQTYFAAAVASGREMTPKQVAAIATGGVFMATEAQAEGIIDGIKTFEDCVARMGELISQRSADSSKEVRMANDKNAPKSGTESAAPSSAAVVDPKADVKRYIDTFGAQGATWYVEGKSFEEATALHNQQIAARVKTLEDELAEARAENEGLKARVVELRGAEVPVSANLPADPAAKGASKDAGSLENRIGKNLAAAARAIVLPKSE